MTAWVDDQIVALDFETSGVKEEYALQPWRVQTTEAWATALMTLQWHGGQWVEGGSLLPTRGLAHPVSEAGARQHITAQYKAGRELIGDTLSDAVQRKQRIVAWNAVFDIQWCMAYGLTDLCYQVSWLDGMLLWRHWFIEPEYDLDRSKKKSYGLKAAVAEILPQYAGYEADVDFHDESDEARAVLWRYGRRDTRFTWVLARHFYRQLETSPAQLRAALIEARCLPMVAESNLRGLPVDRLAAVELAQHMTDLATKSLEVLAPHGVTETIVRSPTQLATLLFDQWQLPVLKENVGQKTQKVSRSTDKEVLHELSLIDERVKHLRVYRGALNNRKKFAEAPVASLDYNGDGCTHPQGIVFGTYSGRLTYSSKQGRGKQERQTGFALHQEKRGAEFRKILMAPPGYTLVEFDAAGQEFRWMAIASHDPTMLALCAPGEDPHSFMGSRIMGREYRAFVAAYELGEAAAKDGRQLGKVGNLSLQYRTSAKKLLSVARVQYNLPMYLSEAERIKAVYLQTYPRVPVYWREQIMYTRQRGWVETFAGRRVQVIGNWDGKLGWSMGSTSINYRIQGTGADQKYLAMAMLRSFLRTIGGRFAWDLHDGIYLFIPDAVVATAVPAMRQILNTLPYTRAWGFTPPIPMPWDCKLGKSWGRLKEWHDGDPVPQAS